MLRAKWYFIIICLFFIAILPISLSSCATSDTRKYAKNFSIERAKTIQKDVGEVSEHIINLRESGYFFLADHVSSASEAMKTELSANGAAFFLVGAGPLAIGAPIHYKRIQSLAKIWIPGNTMRDALLDGYKGLYDRPYLEQLCDKRRVLMYYWYYPSMTPTNHVQSWIFLDSNVFGKERIEDVTKEDIAAYFNKISNRNTWKVKIRYLGTAKYWVEGTINMFDLVEMNPT